MSNSILYQSKINFLIELRNHEDSKDDIYIGVIGKSVKFIFFKLLMRNDVLLTGKVSTSGAWK